MYKIRCATGKNTGRFCGGATLLGESGRASSQTFVLPEGGTEWKTLSTCPEFADLFAAPPPGMTSAVGGVPAGPGKTSSMAIWSLVLVSAHFSAV